MLDDTSATGKRKIDSLVQFANKTIDIAYKDVEIEHIDGYPEKKLSLYNEIGIKAVALFNSKMEYVCELAIPLKYLGANINQGVKFFYNIRMNGAPERGSNGMESVHFNNPGQNLSPDALYLNYPTDFSAQYTLAKLHE